MFYVRGDSIRQNCHTNTSKCPYTAFYWADIQVNLYLKKRRRRTRTVKVRTDLSRPCPTGQTDNGQLFSIIRTESGQNRTESRQKKRTGFLTKFRTESGQRTDTGQICQGKLFSFIGARI